MVNNNYCTSKAVTNLSLDPKTSNTGIMGETSIYTCKVLIMGSGAYFSTEIELDINRKITDIKYNMKTQYSYIDDNNIRFVCNSVSCGDDKTFRYYLKHPSSHIKLSHMKIKLVYIYLLIQHLCIIEIISRCVNLWNITLLSNYVCNVI